MEKGREMEPKGPEVGCTLILRKQSPCFLVMLVGQDGDVSSKFPVGTHR